MTTSDFTKNSSMTSQPQATSCHGEDDNVEMKTENGEIKAATNFLAIDMNIPQPECSSIMSELHQQETSFQLQLNTAAKKQKNTDDNGTSTKSGYSGTLQPLNVSEAGIEETASAKGRSSVGMEDTELDSAAEISFKGSSSPKKNLKLLDLNVKVQVPTPIAGQQTLNEAQQCQLRTQILVYGSLLEGTLPTEALMGVAFADISTANCVDSWEEYIKASKSTWEKVWQTTAMRLQRNATIAGMTSRPVTQDPPPSLCMSSSKTVVSSNPVPLSRKSGPSTSNPVALKTKSAQKAKHGKSSSKFSEINKYNMNLTPPTGFLNPSPVSTCKPSSWNVPLPTTIGMQEFQLANSNLDSSEARDRLFSYPHRGSFSAHPISTPWVCADSTSERWVVTSLPIAHGPAYSEAVTLPPTVRHIEFKYPPYGPATPIVHPVSSSLIATSRNHVSTNGDMVVLKHKTACRRREKSDPKVKRQKMAEFSESPLVSSAQPSANSSVSPSVRPEFPVTTSSTTTGPLMKPVISTCLEASHKADVKAPLVQPPFNERVEVIPFSSATSIPIVSTSKNLVILQEGTTAKEQSSQSTASLLEQAKLRAKEAATSAAMAFEHSQKIWDQFRASNSEPSKDTQLALSAASVSAAASVAKAAAAAAKLAYEAAIQAAVVVQEAVDPTTAAVSAETPFIKKGATSDVTNGGLLVDRESMECDDRERNCSGFCTSVISSAKATVKKQLLSAAAATKRAKNLEAAVEAAEIAVEAAWQAGTVMVMSDPSSMTVKNPKEAGVEDYWKTGLMTLEKEFRDMHASSMWGASSRNFNWEHMRETCEAKLVKGKAFMEKKIQESGNLIQEKLSKKKEISEKELDKKPHTRKKLKENEQMEFSRNSRSLGDSQPTMTSNILGGYSQQAISSKEVGLDLKMSKFVEGSAVEVVPDEEGLHGVWFSAKVLCVKENEVLVVYDELLADDGNGKLQEWVPFSTNKSESIQDAPRVRLAHPLSKDEVSKRRRKSVLSNQLWMVGDHVDAWMRDGWWEGVVTSISEEDENKITVYFPGDGDKKAIKSWNLRPSLMWKDGKWVLLSNEQKETSQKGNHMDKRDTGFPPSRSRRIISSSLLYKSICKPKLPSIPGTTSANISKKRKLVGMMRNNKSNKNMQNTGRKMRKTARTAHTIAHDNSKVQTLKFGKQRKPVLQCMPIIIKTEHKEMTEDNSDTPENDTVKRSMRLINERTSLPASLSSNMRISQVSNPRKEIPVLKKRKYQRKAPKGNCETTRPHFTSA